MKLKKVKCLCCKHLKIKNDTIQCSKKHNLYPVIKYCRDFSNRKIKNGTK